ncbi:hypothetical protein [Helicobacter pylori]|nr:hypothetical protein [Helicobacter pylori]
MKTLSFKKREIKTILHETPHKNCNRLYFVKRSNAKDDWDSY